MIVYFKNQTELGESLKKLVDNYWKLEINEEKLAELIYEIYENNKELLFKDGDYVAIVKRIVGIKRLRVIDTILKNRKEENVDKAFTDNF